MVSDPEPDAEVVDDLAGRYVDAELVQARLVGEVIEEERDPLSPGRLTEVVEPHALRRFVDEPFQVEPFVTHRHESFRGITVVVTLGAAGLSSQRNSTKPR